MTKSSSAAISLDEQLAAFKNTRFLAMPIAGTIAWAAIGVAGAILPTYLAVWAVFIGTGSIFWLGVVVSRFTGEDLLGKEAKSPFFDRIFLLTVVMAVMVYAIAIPFFLVMPDSLPLSVGILAGLMWIPFSGLVEHWVGLFHGIARTVLVLVAWLVWPEQRFVVVPAAVVLVYCVTIAILRRNFPRAPAPTSSAPTALPSTKSR
jgi:hypothetical protein